MNFQSLSNRRSQPEKLIENRIDYTGSNVSLSVYDTYEKCNAIGLDAEDVMFCGMLTGKKVLHIDDRKIDFLPKQAFLLSPGQHVDIDFPTATLSQPTTCITINFSKQKIQEVSDKLNASQDAQSDLPEVQFHYQDHLHESLNLPTQALLDRLILLFTENIHNRDALIELGISELIIRMLSQQSRNFLLSQLDRDPELTGLHQALNYINQNFQEPIDIDRLGKMACMSRSKFFKIFKQSLGCTPAEYIIQRRIEQACQLLKAGKSVTQAAFDSGFTNMSHFTRRFAQRFGVSPKHYTPKLPKDVRLQKET